MAEQQEQDADGDEAGFHQDAPESRQGQPAAHQGDHQRAEGPDGTRFRRREEAGVEPAQHQRGELPQHLAAGRRDLGGLGAAVIGSG